MAILEVPKLHPVTAAEVANEQAHAARWRTRQTRTTTVSMRTLLTRAEAADLQAKIATLREQARQSRERAEAAARAAFTGECFPCRDTGKLPEDGAYCLSCFRGGARQRIDHEQAIKDILTAANIPARCAAFSLASFPKQDSAAYGEVCAFLDVWDRCEGLLLKGPYGTGKTSLLVALLREIAGRMAASTASAAGKPIQFTTGADLLDALRQGYEDGTHAATLERAKRVLLLAIDDLGAEKPSEWVIERLFVIINARYEALLPTFVTTNYGLEELADRVGPRTLERLMEASRVITVDGANLRRRRPSATTPATQAAKGEAMS